MKPLARERFSDPAIVAICDEGRLVAELIRPHFNDNTERILLLSFAADGRLLGASENGCGRPGSAMLAPAMLCSAAAAGVGSSMILAHNHPSGKLRPSADDIHLTRQLAELCRLTGLVLSDHLILTNFGHFSFRAAGLI